MVAVVTVVEVPLPLLELSSREWRWACGGGEGESDFGVNECRFCGDNLAMCSAALEGDNGGCEEVEGTDVVVVVMVVEREVLLVVALLRLAWWSAKEGGLELIRVLAAWFSWRTEQVVHTSAKTWMIKVTDRRSHPKTVMLE